MFMKQLQFQKFQSTGEISIPPETSLAAELEIFSGKSEVSIIVGKNSSLILREMQKISDDEVGEINLKIFLEENSKLSHYSLCGNGKDFVVNRVFFLKRNAELNFATAFFCGGEQKFSFNNVVNHLERDSKSYLRTYGALKGAARCISHGNVKIEKTAQQSSAFLADHALLLDKNARAESIPALEILANNVQAGHSASATRLSPEQLFYCTARGLNEENAKKIIASGFLAKAFEKLDNVEKLTEEIMHLVEEKWK